MRRAALVIGLCLALIPAAGIAATETPTPTPKATVKATPTPTPKATATKKATPTKKPAPKKTKRNPVKPSPSPKWPPTGFKESQKSFQLGTKVHLLAYAMPNMW